MESLLMHPSKYLFILLIFLCKFSFAAPLDKCKPIIFSYSSKELSALKSQNSTLQMSKNDLKKWDDIAKNEVDKNKLKFYQHARLFTYLYVAQEEAANLSCMIKGSYQGSLDPISQKILSLFLPSITKSVSSDPYSENLANIVFAKIEKRVKEENALKNEFIIPKEKQALYSSGLEVAKWIPWYATPPQAFWASPPPPPNSLEWKKGIAEIKSAQAKLTEENKKTVFRWAGVPDHWSDDWRSIANTYFFSHDIPFAKLINARAVLTISLYDTVIACMTMKYHYQAIRPQEYDPTSVYLIVLPKHPTYPAGHAAEGASASIILSYYFPENTKEWERLSREVSLSRVWAGVHYPVDIKGGEESGKKVAKKVLNAVNKN